jgi:hypothetical protein
VVNVKVKLSLVMPLRHTMGEEVELHAFTPLALHGGDWPASQASHFVSCKKPLVALEFKTTRVSLVIFKRAKVSCPHWESSTASPNEYPSHYNDYAPYFDGFYLNINLRIF